MKIICIGRNYVAHAEELNNEVPSSPLIFIKPETALNKTGEMRIPDFTHDLHYELELVLRICKTGKNIDIAEANTYYDAVALGIDFTARDVQSQCKKKGHPWEKAKAFDNSATISDFIDRSSIDLHDIGFSLHRNGQAVQSGQSSLMIYNFSDIISHASEYFTLEKGDLIYTGTPAGVGPVQSGDFLEGFLEGDLLHKVKII